MERLIALIVIIFCYTVTLQAQELCATNITDNSLYTVDNSTNTPDSLDMEYGVTVKADSILSNMLLWHVEMNERVGTFKGYRVQIFFGSGQGSRENAQTVKKQFLTRFPEHKAYITYNAPDFKVRVGDFRSKSEALGLKKSLETEFKDSFIVPENINYPEL